MRVFHCSYCNHVLFFENTHCVACGHHAAFVPDYRRLVTLEPAANGNGEWRSSKLPSAKRYRLCRNYSTEQVCNWALRADAAGELCLSCELTRVIPDLDVPGNRDRWYRLEVAKRRLLFSLLSLRLPLGACANSPETGLSFEFKADSLDAAAPQVITGHFNGLIRINVAEADDAERERTRTAMHEPYRTLLGHMRHESGHYYWGRLINERPQLDEFRRLFGDERADYASALQVHYERGAPPDWQARVVSAYASSHPWEDWAETWAHYLHIVDTLETAATCGLSMQPARDDEPALAEVPTVRTGAGSFDGLIEAWFPLTYALNNLNRGMGLADAYPFVLSRAAIEKLRFVHDVIGGSHGAHKRGYCC